MPVAAHRVQLAHLQARERLRMRGEVAQRSAPQGIYADGWSDGDLIFSIETAGDIDGFTVLGLLPDWWPEESVISIEINGERVTEAKVTPGRFQIECEARIPRGGPVRVGVRTSTKVHDSAQNRHLGAYVGEVVFHRSAALGNFRCNICSSPGNYFDSVLNPEASVCRSCGSNIRQRTVAALVADAIFGRTIAFAAFPRSETRVVGISDSPRFAQHLSQALPFYRNAQFDSALVSDWAPYADVKAPPPELRGSADLVICSEVLEHVEPPVQDAFAGLFTMLRPGGTLILTVPYTLGETVEHFPELHTWHLEQRQGSRVLVNRTKAGELQVFDKLTFHGGGEDVLEMRVFALQDILTHLEDAGFTDIRVHDENALEYGIFLKYNFGLPITARRPS